MLIEHNNTLITDPNKIEIYVTTTLQILNSI